MSEYPGSLARLLSLFRPCFTAPTFATFCALCVGFLACVGEHTVTGMLVAARRERAWHHSRAHDFFARARWSADELGLTLLAFLVERFLPVEARLVLAVDDSLFPRSGRKVFGAHLHRDDHVAGGGRQVRFGNSWVVLGLVITLPSSSRTFCLPLLFRLWRADPARRGHGKKGNPRKRKPDPAYPSKPELARELIELVAARHPGRRLQLVADGAYAAKALRQLPQHVELTTRLLATAALYAPTPPPSGRRGRPALKGERLPDLRTIANDPNTGWQRIAATGSGVPPLLDCHLIDCLWYGVFHTQPVRVLIARTPQRRDGFDIALVTTDLSAGAKKIIERYAQRWSIEVSFQDAKQQTGVGEARNRSRRAVERTVPFGLLCQTLVVAWYALNGQAQEDVLHRRKHAPWYRHKRAPSYQDMLVSLRRALIAAEYPPVTPAGRHREEIPTVAHQATGTAA
jgi:hypothetical protein